MKEQVKAAIEKIRPNLQADGGDIELVEITDDNDVKVRLKGACGSCPFAQMTLQTQVTTVIKQSVPEVNNVVSVD